MELSFDYAPDRQFYAVRFEAGAYESVPFIQELRFWGVSRMPCPRLSTLAALLTLKNHPMIALTLSDAALNPPVCAALSLHFGVEIHPSTYNINRRDLAGGDKTVAPIRYSHTPPDRRKPVAASEELAWISLDDLSGPFGGTIRTNIDAFDLGESEKNLIVALCCAGKDLGHIALYQADPAIEDVLHRIGLELILPDPV